MLIRPGQQGFSLVELLVAIALLTLLAIAALPNLGSIGANARVRSAAESLQNGLRLAQGAAVQRNRRVVFLLTNDAPSLAAAPAADGRNWVVRSLPLYADSKEVDKGTQFIQGGQLAAAGTASVSGPAQLCFNAYGRPDADAVKYSGTSQDFTSACSLAATGSKYDLDAAGASRRLRVAVSLGGRVRMCTPDASSAQLLEACL